MSSHRLRMRRLVGVIASLFSVLALFVALPATVAPAPAAEAANAADWNPGNIIDDALFYDSNAMGAPEIQAFLEQKVRSCRAGFTCLKDYRQNTDNRPADKYCNGYSGSANESAATIIDRVARSCGISQKVLLVLLEKEQSLVTHTAPDATRYLKATGQGCPDTAPCDSATAGFFYQVYYAARQYEIYRLNPTWWGYQAGRWNNILYSPYADRNCGSQRVFIENQATAGLYIYTPYVPNAAALNNLYSTGDNCSSYGNRNFWRIFTDWFGSTRSYNNPFGNVELIRALPGEFEIAGWAADLDTMEPISVHVYVGSVGTALTADIERPDVGAAYPAVGSRHGFSIRVPATGPGQFDVCVYGINAGTGANVLMRCQKVTAMSGSPTGVLELVAPVDGGVEVSGWAIDPDTSAPATLHVYVDSVGTAIVADRDRADVAAHFPAYGAKHGFGVRLPATSGPHTVCVYGINVGAGGNVQFGCRSVVVPGAQIPELGRPPIGVFEALSVSGSTAVASGWAIDPDTASSIKVHIYVSGKGTEYTADAPRTDVARIYPAYGEKHGFVQQLSLPPGKSDVCAYAINTGSGGHTFLGCRTAEVVVQMPELGRAPIGVFEGLTVTGSTAVASGWAIDPDTASSIKIHIYVGGRGAEYTADAPRADVGRTYPEYGERHGFVQELNLPPGKSDVCAYAINTGAGGHSFLGCRTAEIAIQMPDLGRAPIGNYESAVPVAGGANVSGWALDPDTTQPISVHIYVDSTGAAYTADKPRGDVAAAYGLGDRHGFAEFIPMTSGSHTVCVYPINTGAGGNSWLGCRTITVP